MGRPAPILWLVILAVAFESLPSSPTRSQPATDETPFPSWVAERARGLEWNAARLPRRMTREILEQSLAAGRRFLLANQRPEGNFNYSYDWIARQMEDSDNGVRQAGAVWGLALIDHFESDAQTRAALSRGLDFFLDHSVGLSDGRLAVVYPGEQRSMTGGVALVALALVERLREDGRARPPLSPARRKKLEGALDSYLRFLLSAQLSDGHFADAWSLEDQRFEQRSNPYADGESLLALAKAARWTGRAELVPVIERTAPILARDYTRRVWPEDPDSKLTKGFFQWGCMAFAEHRDAGWDGSEMLGDLTLTLGWWMIHVHRTLERRRNTAYAYEGLIQAYRVAAERDDRAAIDELGDVIDAGLTKLTSWQVGGPLATENRLLYQLPTNDPLALGGVMNAKHEAPLRIDVTQHQMHAVILALRHVYRE